MARILFVWELGVGLGHLTSIRPLAAGLAAAGHEIIFALRSLSHARTLLSDPSSRFLQAPIKTTRTVDPIDRPATYSQVLYNVGFGDAEELTAMTQAWRELFAFVDPQLVVADHSPTALLAAQNRTFRLSAIGTGFSCPDAQDPCKNLRPRTALQVDLVRSIESCVVDNMNQVLDRIRAPRMAYAADLFSAERLDAQLLLTYPELDPYQRSNGPYFGIWPEIAGVSPLWPEGGGLRILAYLKPFPAMVDLIRNIAGTGHQLILRMSPAPMAIQRAFADLRNVAIEHRLIDMDQTLHDCDLAVTNATHITTASVLLAARPSLLAPPYLDQQITAERVAEMGAGVIADQNDSAQCIASFQHMIARLEDHRSASQLFRARYGLVDRNRQVLRAIDVLCQQADAHA